MRYAIAFLSDWDTWIGTSTYETVADAQAAAEALRATNAPRLQTRIVALVTDWEA